MYQNVSAAFMTALNRTSRTFQSKITVNGSATTDIKSYSLVSGSCGSEVFSLGTVFSSYVNITMPAQEITLAGQEFLLETGVKLDNGTFEYIPMGYFTANPSDISKSRDQILIKASDRITSKCRGTYAPSVTFPATIQDIIDDIESQADITVVTSLTTTGTVETSFPMMLCYEALGYIAGLLGGFCYADRSGNICIAAYPEESTLDVSRDRVFQMSVNESEYTLNRIAVTVSPGGENADGEEIDPVVYTAGSGDGIDLYNPFMTQTLFTAMSGRMQGYSFFPGTVSFLGDPRLDPVDALAAENYEETEFLIPCMNIEQTFDGGLKTTVTAPGIVSSDQAAQGPLSQQIEKMEADMMLANEVIAKKISADEANIRYGTIEKAVIGSATISDLSTAKLNFTTAVGQLFTADQVTALNAAFDTATVGAITADNINTSRATFESALAGSFTAEEITAAAAAFQKAIVDELYVANLDANYAHITNGEIDNAKIGYADVNGLSANYAQINLANVNNAWIENGVVKDAAITSAQILGVSANKLTAGTIDASDINVANLRAKNLIVEKMNGQPILGGYELVNKNSTGYSGKNPSNEGWYEYSNGTFVASTDTTVNMSKAYYKDGTQVALYDQTYIDGLENNLQQQIDGAIETFTGSVVPTLVNYPAVDWTSAQMANHVGDIYYVVNAGNDYDGYSYRFSYDNSTSTYSWRLIRDSGVTAALADISDLQTFQSETTSWINETDDGLETIRQNHTSLSGVVNKTVKSSTQLWFTKANTTAPTAPTSEVTSDSTSGNAWRRVVPTYNASYPYYFYCWQYKYVDNTFGWSAVIYDQATTESEERARTGVANAATADGKAVSAQNTANANIKSSVQLWFTKANTTAPSKPASQVTNNSATGSNSYNKWNLVVPVYNSSYPYYYYCYQQQKGDGTYQWSDVVYDQATSEAMKKAQEALPASTFTTFESTTFKNVTDTVDEQSTTITNLTTRVDNIQIGGRNYAKNNVPIGTTRSGNNGAIICTTIGPSTVRLNGTASGVTAFGWGDYGGIELEPGNYCLWLTNTNNGSIWFRLGKGDDNTHVYSSEINASKSNPYKFIVETKEKYQFHVICKAGTYNNMETSYMMEQGTLASDWSPAPEDTEGAITTISNTVNAVSQTATSNSSKLSQLTTTLGTNADGTTKTGDVMHRMSATEQDLSGFKTTVSQTYTTKDEFNNLEIGGRNLLKDSKNLVSGWNLRNATVSEGVATITGSSSDDNRIFQTPATGYWGVWKPNTEYVVSVEAKSSNGATLDFQPIGGSRSKSFTVTSEWKRYSFAFTSLDTEATSTMTFSTRNTTGATLQLRLPKLEYGNKATDYSPAPDDYSTTTQMESAITQSASDITLAVSENYTTKTDFENLEIGGRNLFKTNAPIGTTETTNNVTFTLVGASSFTLNGTPENTSSGSWASSNAKLFGGLSLEPGKYKVSVESSDSNATPIVLRYGKGANASYFAQHETFPATLTITEKNVYFAVPCHKTGVVTYSDSITYKIKLEKGDKVTDWTPAPEDLEKYADNAVSSFASRFSVTPEAISSEVQSTQNGETLVTRINQTPESVKIEAEHVEIDGTAVFNAISSDVDSAITGKGYQTSSQVESAITGKGYQTSSQVESAITSKGYQTASQVSTAITNGITGKADKTDAVSETQRIYYRSNAVSSGVPVKPNGNGLPSTWVTATGDVYNTTATNASGWTRKVTPISNGTGSSVTKYLYLWTCIQKKTVSGTVTYGDILLDDSTTVIDGGKIITGSISTNRIDATSAAFDSALIPNLDASKISSGTISVNYLPDDALNSNIEIGGRNLFKTNYEYGYSYTANGVTATLIGPSTFTLDGTSTNTGWAFPSSDIFGGLILEPGTYTVNVEKSNSSSEGINIRFGKGTSRTYFTEREFFPATLTITEKDVYYAVPDFYSGKTYSSSDEYRIKLEKGNKATAWIPAVEDVQANIDAKKSIHTLDTNYTYTYANILTYSAEGFPSAWNISSASGTSGVKIGDTVRLKVTASDMGTNGTPVYIVTTVTGINSSTQLTAISHGLDTTIIDGGNILTNSITANQIASNSITADKLSINIGNRNYATLKSRFNTSYTAYGGTTSVNSDASIQANGTFTSSGYALGTSALIRPTLSAGTYCIWCTNTALCNIRIGTGSSNAWKTDGRYTKSNPYKLVLESDTQVGIGVIVDAGTYNNTLTNLVIEKGDLPTDWSPAPEDTDVNKYVTEINSDGIWVTPQNKKPSSSSGATGTKIDSTGVGIYNAGTKYAQYGTTTQLGADSTGNVLITSNGMQVRNGTTTLAEYGSTITIGTPSSTSSSVSISNSEFRHNIKETDVPIFTSHAELDSSDHSYVTVGTRAGSNTPPGSYSFTSGRFNLAGGQDAVAIGNTTTADGDCSFASGEHTVAGYYNQAVFGSYNDNNQNNLLEVGNGGTYQRSNAFTVNKSGYADAKAGYKVAGYTPIVIEEVSATNVSINHGAIYTWNKTGLTKTGYTLAGIVGYSVAGTGSSVCNPYYCRKTGDSSFQMLVSNIHASTNASGITLIANVLWIANGMI